ncbi:MAG: TetR/AcrR family transcriptional regulator [Bacteroidia bacterium]|jgi:AcrR family transcriptional regulator
MDEVKEKILIEAENLFMRYGFKSITMDDVSRELGVSKKTLYLHFADKHDLVNQCVECHLERMNQTCSHLIETKEDPISTLLAITEFNIQQLQRVSQSSIYDLKKYFKGAWDKLMENRNQFIYKSIKANLELGMKKGLYRKELDPEVVGMIYIHLVSLVIDPANHRDSEMDLRKILLEIVSYHLNSVCTEKGREILDEKLKKIKK